VSSRYPPRVDVLLGVALTAAGLYIAHQSASLPKIPAQAYGPGIFPQLGTGKEKRQKTAQKQKKHKKSTDNTKQKKTTRNQTEPNNY